MLFNPNLLYLKYLHSHLILIGFIAQVIIATMFRQITVLTSSELFSSKLEKGTFYLFNIGMIIFIIERIIGSIILMISFYLYMINVVATIVRSKVKPNIIYYYLCSSVILTIGVTFGVLNLLLGGLTITHMYLTILGGVTLIIIGAMSFMLPMVLVKEVFSKKIVEYLLYLFVISILGLVLTNNVLFKIMTIILLVLFFINMIATYFKKDKKKVKSVEARFFVTSLFYMLIGTSYLMIKYDLGFLWHVLLIGFIIQTIIGAMYHIVPTTVYIEYIKKGIMVKHFKELFSEKLSIIIYILLNTSLILFILGFIAGIIYLKILGGVLLFLTLLTFSAEMLKILIKPKL